MTANGICWVMLPTYNESSNIVPLVRAILSLGIPDLSVVVVDDQSPDGTAEAARSIGVPAVHVLVRSGPRGRGLAGKEGFQYCVSHGAQLVVEMDADGSHRPEDIPVLLAAVQEADVVVGSRFVPGGGDPERPWLRRMITQFANRFLRAILGIPLHDCDSGFRCYRRRVLEAIGLETLRSKGPSIVLETQARALQKGFKFREVPIRFCDRQSGKSKFGPRALLGGVWWALRLKWQML